MLNKPCDEECIWGSHQPVLKAVLKVLQPQSAVECGCGDFSTPHLHQSVSRLTTIEHDVRWASKICKQYSASHHTWILNKFKTKNSTCTDELSDGEYKIINKNYNEISNSFESFDLLFVDTLRSCRVSAILALGPKAQWIILHDVRKYQHHLLEDFFDGWYNYEHRPKDYKLHRIPWTALYSKTPLDLNLINPVVMVESERLWNQKIELEDLN